MADELKPCPFCGKDRDVSIEHCGDKGWVVMCCWCEKEVSDYDKAEAIKEWNTRPTEQALRDEIKSLKDQLADFSQQIVDLEREACEREANG